MPNDLASTCGVSSCASQRGGKGRFVGLNRHHRYADSPPSSVNTTDLPAATTNVTRAGPLSSHASQWPLVQWSRRCAFGLIACLASLCACPEFAHAALTYHGHLTGVLNGPEGPRGTYDVSFHFSASALAPGGMSVPLSAVTFDSWALPPQVSPALIFAQSMPVATPLSPGGTPPALIPVVTFDAALPSTAFAETAFDAPPIGYQVLKYGLFTGASSSFNNFWVRGSTQSFTLTATETVDAIPEPASVIV